MRAVVQRVKTARVRVADETVGEIGPGLLVLLAVDRDDTPAEIEWMANKLISLRIFDDADGRLNLSVQETGGAMLIVSQFTLLGECQKGRRPSFDRSAKAEQANAMYNAFVARVRELGIPTATGTFRAEMLVELINEGPITLVVDTPANLGRR